MASMTSNPHLQPSSLGFADDGDLWQARGSVEGFFQWLEERGHDFRDWFVGAAWAREENLADHRLPPMGEVHPIQDYVVEETLEHYRAVGYLIQKEDQHFYESYPTLFKWEGKYFIFQGTHRLAAHYSTSPATYRGWLIDLDAS